MLLPAFDFPERCTNKLFCHPTAIAKLEPLRQQYTAKLGVGELHVLSSNICPPDEAWMFDHTGKLIRLVWGERHSKSMATCGPRELDANGTPVEAA